MSEKSPRGGFADTRKRGEEKREQVYIWLAEYHYSTTSILARVLGVDSVGQWAFFKGMIDAGLLRKIDIPTVREKVFLLTRDGKEFAAGVTEKALKYATEPGRIPVSMVRHNLCVQLAVLERLTPGMKHTFEKHLDFTDRDKLPDAVLDDGQHKIALEIELSHKRNLRIYRAFYDHIAAMKHGHYQSVEYVFSSSSLRDNYQKKFAAVEWPVVERKNGRLRQTDRVFKPDEIEGLRERFLFSVQNFDERK